MKDLTKLKKAKDLRNLNAEDLQKELDQATKDLYSVRMGLKFNTERQTHTVRPLRKYVARINTVATEQQIILK